MDQIQQPYRFALPEDLKRKVGYADRLVRLHAQLAEIPCQEISSSDKLPSDPDVSVMMMAYRHEKYIARAIESVLHQKTGYRFELIVAEDHSPDRTMEIVREYREKYPHLIRILTADVNVGMQKNCWRMFAKARGRFLAFCDGDDFWSSPDKLQKQLDLMVRTPDCVMCHSNYTYLNTLHGTQIIDRFNKKDLGNASGKELLLGVITDRYRVRTPTMVFRADAFQEIFPLFGTLPHPAYDFSINLLLALTGGQFCYIDEPLATYCQVASSATSRDKREKRFRFLQEVTDSGIAMLEALGLHEYVETEKKYMIPALLDLALVCGDFRAAKQYNGYLLSTGYYCGIRKWIGKTRIMPLLWLETVSSAIAAKIKMKKSYRKQQR